VRERVREFLGVWAPMLLGLLLIAFAGNFLLTPRGPGGNPLFALDPISASLCGGAVVVVGGILVLSTYGRWRKSRAVRDAGGSQER